jgi:hypothetical protein
MKLPRATTHWSCPYFLSIMFSCTSCIFFGLLDGSTFGATVAVAAGIVAGGPLQTRTRNGPDSCSN